MNYYIKYKLYNQEEYIEFKFHGEYPDLQDAIFQLGKGLGRFNNTLIKGFSVIEYLEISEQNYDFKSDGKHYEICEIDAEMREQMGDECYEMPACLEDEMHIQPYQKDITNRLFRECNVSINSLGKTRGIRLSDSKLYVNNVPFSIEKKSKIYEILDILISIRSYARTDTISYEKIEEYYMKNLFSELKLSDLNKESIKNILKSKIEKIGKELGFDKPFISAQDSGVVFRI